MPNSSLPGDPARQKKKLTIQRVLALVLAYLILCIGGGAVTSFFLLPAVVGMNNVAQAVLPSLQVEGIDFDVTSLPQKSTMYANDGTTVIAEFYEQNRVVVPLKEISKPMQQAVVAREDKRFWQHSGVDVQGVMRAFVQTYMMKGDQQGGSSLTQQYVKNVLIMQAEESNDPIAQYHASEDTIARKIREMLIAVQMEKVYSKPEILQGYLNIAQFGRNNLYGVEAAAERYFNVSASELNIVQAATIAAITKNPENYDPSVEENQEEAEKQRNVVLQLMYEQGFIETEKEYQDAVNTPLKDTLDIQSVARGCMAAQYDAGFFCDYVVHKIQNSEEFGKTAADRNALLKEGGLKIVTTLDIDANTLMNETARNTIPPDDSSGMEIVMASVEPGTGKVLGFGLNRTYDATDAAQTDQTLDSMNYAVDYVDGGGQGFSIGSSWKPINLVAWMEAGHSINENLQTTTRYPTSEFACDDYTGGSEVWNVTNALTNSTVNPESPFLGLVRSHNTTQASMGAIIGLCAVADTATEVGYHDAYTGAELKDSPSSFVPAMLVGNVNVSPLTMASIFAVYASNGVQCDPIAMTEVTDKSGKSLDVPSANCHQAVDPEIIQTLAYTLNQGVVRSDGAGSVAQLANGRKTFAKTGTHEDQLVTTGGFIPNEIATFVLVGDVQNPVGNPIANISINGEYHSYWDGSTIAAPAWRDFMNAYAERKQLPIDNKYGQPSSKYTATSSTVTRINGATVDSGNSYRNSTNSNSTNSMNTNGNTNSNTTNNSTNTGGTTDSNNANTSNEANGTADGGNTAGGDTGQ